MTKRKASKRPVKEIFEKAKKGNREVLTIVESFEILKHYGIPLANYEVAKTAEKAAKAAKKMGYPVALKAISKRATHKTDIGGLVLNIDSEKIVRNAFKKIHNSLKKAKADFGGVIVQKMVGSSIGGQEAQEVMVGGKKDPQFGQTIAFGLGGVFVEVFEDITFRVVPITEKDANTMIKEIRGHKILEGYRDKKYDKAAISNILLKVSKLLEENENIAELDINPIMVLAKGALAVDARIVIE